MSRVERLSSNGNGKSIVQTAYELGFTSKELQLLQTPYDEVEESDMRGMKSEILCVTAICSLEIVDTFRWATLEEDYNDKIDAWIEFNTFSGHPDLPVQIKTSHRAAKSFRNFLRKIGRDGERLAVVYAIPPVGDGHKKPDPVEHLKTTFLSQLLDFDGFI